MDLLTWSGECVGASLSIELDVESLHPIGYKRINEERYPILLGGREYSFLGTASIHSKSRSGYRLENAQIKVENLMTSVLGNDNTREIYISEVKCPLEFETVIHGITDVPFRLDGVVTSFDSYDGILTSLIYRLVFLLTTHKGSVAALQIPFFVHFPMPMLPITTSLSETLGLFDVLQFEIHLDRTVFTVNDIITGWIRILSAKYLLLGMTLRLKRIESLIFENCDGRKEVVKQSVFLDPVEILDTIYPVKSPLQEDRKGVSEVTFSASDRVVEEDVGRIPFRLFIREENGVCPCYSQVKNCLSVDWQLEIGVHDRGAAEYVQYVDIDIVRGDIMCISSIVCYSMYSKIPADFCLSTIRLLFQ